MLPITMITATAETISNPVHPIVAEHIDLILPLAVSVLAVIISAYYTSINRTRASRSEQIKTSRYMWERITVRIDKIQEIANTKKWNQLGQKDIELKDLWPVVREIDYFAYLILIGEIKDRDVLDYYKIPLSDYIHSILKYYTPPEQRENLYSDYTNFDELIKKWNINLSDLPIV